MSRVPGWGMIAVWEELAAHSAANSSQTAIKDRAEGQCHVKIIESVEVVAPGGAQIPGPGERQGSGTGQGGDHVIPGRAGARCAR